MQQLFKDFVQDVLSQLFGVAVPRGGTITVTNYAFTKMKESGLSFEYLADAFRFGEEVGQGKIMRSYYDFTVGLIYKPVERKARTGKGTTRQFVIITCWKGVRK